MLVELDLLGSVQSRIREEGDLGVLALRRLEDRLGREPLVYMDRRSLDNDLVALFLLAGPDKLGGEVRVEPERATRDRGNILPSECCRRVVQSARVCMPVVADLLAVRRDSRPLSVGPRNLPVGSDGLHWP